MGVGIALMSYNRRIYWGFNANPDVIPDLEVFVDQIRKSMERLAEICPQEARPEESSPDQEQNVLRAIPVKRTPDDIATQRNGSEG